MSATGDASTLAASAPTAAAASPVSAPASSPAQPPRSSQPRKAEETPVRKIEPPFPEHRVLLRIDEATQIIQAQVRDAASGRLLYDLPDDHWLRVAAELRAFAATAIVDKSV